MDVWLLAQHLQALIYGTSVCWSFVYVSLKVSLLQSQKNSLVIFIIAGSFALYGCLKTFASFIDDTQNYSDYVTWLKDIEPGGYAVSKYFWSIL